MRSWPLTPKPWERGRPALVEGGTPSLPGCSLRAGAAAPAAKTPRTPPGVFLGNEGVPPSVKAD